MWKVQSGIGLRLAGVAAAGATGGGAGAAGLGHRGERGFLRGALRRVLRVLRRRRTPESGHQTLVSPPLRPCPLGERRLGE